MSICFIKIFYKKILEVAVLSFELMIMNSALVEKQAVEAIVSCNELTEGFGLYLSAAEAAELVNTRTSVLRSNGRVEFGGGVIDRLIREFCDSPYISMHNYAETLHELIELFYYYKNETMDLMSDEELIKFMKDSFDGKCQGSLELLSGRELANMARNLRYGYPPGLLPGQ
jgi:hypothetical protein